MINLAIKEEKKFNEEIVKIFECLGGKVQRVIISEGVFLYINNATGLVSVMQHWNARLKDYVKFTYSDFIEKFPYLPGDKVILLKKDYGVVEKIRWENGRIEYMIRFDENKQLSNWHITSDLEPFSDMSGMFVQTGKITAINFQDQNYSEEVKLILNDGYDIIFRSDGWFAIKKNPTYPRTCEECRKWIASNQGVNADPSEISINKLRELITARNVYWKIANNWKPNWEDDSVKYIIETSYGEVSLGSTISSNVILCFPTLGIRNEFYHNFKDLIEDCKEYL